MLEEKRLLLKSGTIVDATIIAAPPSTKNEQKARDPQMHQTRKGKDWHFGMKAHIGTDRRGFVHSLSSTAANVSDITQMPELLHGEEREVFADQAYWSEAHRQAALAKGICYPGQPTLAPLERAPEVHQPSPLRRAGPCRACVSSAQAFVGLQQSLLPRVGQEHRAPLHRFRAGESVSAQAALDAAAGKVRLMVAEDRVKPQQHRRKPLATRSNSPIPMTFGSFVISISARRFTCAELPEGASHETEIYAL